MSRLHRRTCAICEDFVIIDNHAPWIDKAIDSSEQIVNTDKIQIADATCACCGARYSAWRGYLYGDIPVGCEFVDLSFRSTFGNRPGPDDLPTPEMLQQLHENSCLWHAGMLREKASKLIAQAIETEDLAVTGTSEWESFRNPKTEEPST